MHCHFYLRGVVLIEPMPSHYWSSAVRCINGGLASAETSGTVRPIIVSGGVIVGCCLLKTSSVSGAIIVIAGIAIVAGIAVVAGIAIVVFRFW